MRACSLLLLFVAALPAAAQPVPADTLVARAFRLSEVLLRGDGAAAPVPLDAAMEAALTLEQRTALRQQLDAQVGALTGRGAPRLREEGGYRQVRTRHTFERAELDVIVVFRADGHVMGFFLRPPEPEETTVPYADTTAFRERPFRLTRPDAPPLDGTLAVPVRASAPVPVVLLVHGSGPLDRDETVGGTRVFRDLAHGLAARGVAVLRYDKRTRAYPDAFQGPFTVEEETVADALAALAALRRSGAPLDTARVVLVGHSLGALMAPQIAGRDGRLAGAALLAGPSRPLVQTLIGQFDHLEALDTTAASRAAFAEARALARRVLDPADTTEGMLAGYPLTWWRALRGYDPVTTAQALDTPLFIAGGGRDYQVPPVEFEGWQRALQGRPRVTLVPFDDLNHLLVAGEGTSTPAEYSRPAFVDVRVVEALAAWIAALPPVR
jgi:uncharacterized protein